MNGSRFHFHHGPFGRPGHVERIAALEHDAFDRVGIGAGAGRRRIVARGAKIVPAREGNKRRKVNARFIEPRDEIFEPRAALGKRKLAQIFVPIGKQDHRREDAREIRPSVSP